MNVRKIYFWFSTDIFCLSTKRWNLFFFSSFPEVWDYSIEKFFLIPWGPGFFYRVRYTLPLKTEVWGFSLDFFIWFHNHQYFFIPPKWAQPSFVTPSTSIYFRSHECHKICKKAKHFFLFLKECNVTMHALFGWK